MMYESKIIAFTGIDGAGKTSLIKKLALENRYPFSCYLRKEDSRNFKIINKYFPKSSYNHMLEGTFSEMAALAAALDFVNHYDVKIAPNIGKYRYIFCDRYTICYLANAATTTIDTNLVDLLVKKIKKPDVIFHLKVDVDIALQRLRDRGDTDDGESREVLESFDRKYDILLKQLEDQGIPIQRINANVEADQIYDLVIKQLEAIIKR